MCAKRHILYRPVRPKPDSILPPRWITSERIANTRTTWQPYYSETLTDEDAIEMLLTVGNLYRVLAGADDDESEEETSQER